MSTIGFVLQAFDLVPLQEIGKIYAAAHKAKGFAYGEGPNPYDKIKMFRNIAARQGDLRFILAHQQVGPGQQKLQGFACFEKTRDDEFFLHDLCTITPPGSGVGAATLNVMFQAARQENIETVSLTSTLNSNAFYEKLFFENTGMTEQGIEMQNNQVAETAELLQAVYATPRI